MKNANDFSMDCNAFHMHLRAFIDDELPVNLHSDFIRHADACNECRQDMQALRKLQKSLAGMRRVEVSTGFDFRMKSSIRREYDLLRNPMYKFKLFFFDNFARFMMVPAFALVLATGMVLYRSYTVHNHVTDLPAAVVSHLESQESVMLGPNEEWIDVDEVRYVLESVQTNETVSADSQSSPSDRTTALPAPPAEDTLTLVSF